MVSLFDLRAWRALCTDGHSPRPVQDVARTPEGRRLNRARRLRL